MAGTCRCPMCGPKNASHRGGRASYRRCGIVQDENGVVVGFKNKRQSRKVRRVREDREWKVEAYA